MPSGSTVIEVGAQSARTKLTNDLIATWEKRWGLPDLADTIEVEFSSRLKISLGRTLVRVRTIRLHPVLLHREHENIFPEVLCHEVAHVAVVDLHGEGCKPHGPEWTALVAAAGFPPRLQIALEVGSKDLQGKSKRATTYEHRCPVCHAVRFSRRRMKQWRCAECIEAGLKGELNITSHSI